MHMHAVSSLQNVRLRNLERTKSFLAPACLSFFCPFKIFKFFFSFLQQTLVSLYFGFTATGFKLAPSLEQRKLVPISFYIVQSVVAIDV